MLTDPIGDMIAAVKNAHLSKKPSVSVPSSKMKKAILAVWEKEGYIDGFTESTGLKKILTVHLRYYGNNPAIEMDIIKRISKPGLRIYINKEQLSKRKVLGGLGIAVVSTSKGVMSDRQALQLGLGGEVICEIA